MINIADLPDPDHPGKTYRQVNNSKTHLLSIGDLVQLNNGVRMFVAKCGRDCDGTPLYWLSGDTYDECDRVDTRFMYLIAGKWIGGYPDEDLTLITKKA